MILKDYVKALENLSGRARGDRVIQDVRDLGLSPLIQEKHRPAIRNIILDFSTGAGSRQIVFSAHYDAVKGSSGANDDASGVAVLLGLCRELKSLSVPVRVIFFDREEAWLRTTLIKLGLLGSEWYVIKNEVRNIDAVYNLEFVGNGDTLGIWPVKPGSTLPPVQTVQTAAAKIKIPIHSASIPWILMSSDHLSFRLRGVHNAITLSLFPATSLNSLAAFFSQLKLPKMIWKGRPALPEPLATVHTRKDTAENITEDSLQLILSILLEIVRLHFDLRTV